MAALKRGLKTRIPGEQGRWGRWSLRTYQWRSEAKRRIWTFLCSPPLQWHMEGEGESVDTGPWNSQVTEHLCILGILNAFNHVIIGTTYKEISMLFPHDIKDRSEARRGVLACLTPGQASAQKMWAQRHLTAGLALTHPTSHSPQKLNLSPSL